MLLNEAFRRYSEHMTSFSLRSVRLRPGEEHRDEQEVELQPLVLGGQRYLPVPEKVPAELAITLGKTYRQEGALAWGYLTPPDDVKSEHVKLTARKRGRGTARRPGGGE